MSMNTHPHELDAGSADVTIGTGDYVIFHKGFSCRSQFLLLLAPAPRCQYLNTKVIRRPGMHWTRTDIRERARVRSHAHAHTPTNAHEKHMHIPLIYGGALLQVMSFKRPSTTMIPT